MLHKNYVVLKLAAFEVQDARKISRSESVLFADRGGSSRDRKLVKAFHSFS